MNPVGKGDKRVRIAAICGSIKPGSSNHELLLTARRVAPSNCEVVIFESLDKIEPFVPLTESATAPSSVQQLRQIIASSDAVLIACPEYGFSLPGVLKNAIDWLIGTGELERKIVAITAAVPISGRGEKGLRALAEPLRAVSARIVGGRGLVKGPDFDREVQSFLQEILVECEHGDNDPHHGMGLLRPRTLVEAWVEAFNQSDSKKLALFYRLDATNHQTPEAPVVGRLAIGEMFERSFASAKMECIIENIFEDGDWAILEWRDPKGLRGCGFFFVQQGEIVMQRGYWDKLTFLRQQGLALPKE